MASDSPSFFDPPIREVVVGVQFDRADQSVVHLGRFSQTLATKYPNVIEAPPIPRVLEPSRDAQFAIPPQIVLGAHKPRVQMYDGTGNRFLQIQVDRFHANWQKVSDADEYPRFDVVLRQFFEGWQAWKEYCGPEPPVPVQYEITYVNHVFAGELWQPENGAASVCPWLTSQPLEGVPELECSLHYWVQECAGRLHVTVRTAKRIFDNAHVLGIELTLRGDVAVRGRDDDMGAWMKAAHDRIVSAFVALTSDEAHKVWRLQAKEVH